MTTKPPWPSKENTIGFFPDGLASTYQSNWTGFGELLESNAFLQFLTLPLPFILKSGECWECYGCHLELKALKSHATLLVDRGIRLSQILTISRQGKQNIKLTVFDAYLKGMQGHVLTKILPHTRGNGWTNCLVRHFAQLFLHLCKGLYLHSLRCLQTCVHVCWLNRSFYSCVLSCLALEWKWAGADLAFRETSLLFSC